MKIKKLYHLIFEKKKGKKKDNRGITLLELIITVAVLSVVLIMIFSMMSSGSNFFTKSRDSIATTYSLQQTLSQIKETVIDSDHCIIVENTSTGTNKFTVVNMTSSIGAVGTVEKKFHFYAYRFEDGVIKYGELEVSNPTTPPDEDDVPCDHILCNGVESFNVVPSTVSVESVSYIKRLKIELEVKKNNRVDSAVETVSPRNMTRQVDSYDKMPVE